MALHTEDEFDPAVDEDIPEAPAPDAAPTISTTELNAKLIAVMEKLAERQDEGPIKQIPLPKAKLRTPWNPSGRRIGRPKFARNTYMNGNKLREILHSDEEITLFTQVKAGRYLNGHVIVSEKFSSDQGTDEVEIRVANKTTSDKIAMAQFAPDLATLLKKIIAEAASRNAA